MPNTQKKINVEFIRIFAMIMTVMIHVSNIYVYGFSKIDRYAFLTGVIYNSFARVCVPLFFMISGMFLIKSEFDKKKYFKRILKFILILIFWSVAYYLLINGFNFKNVGVMFVNSFFNANMTSKHLWFMYAMIGISIALPFIRNMCNNLTRWQENLFIGLWVVLSGLDVFYVPLAQAVLKTEPDVAYPIPIINAAYYLGYFVCGHIIYQRVKDVKLNKNKNLLLFAVYLLSTAITIIFTYAVSVLNNELFDAMMWYRSAFIIISSFSLFVLVIVNGDKFKSKIIPKISKYSFGIYLIHMVFLYILKDKFSIIDYNPIIFIPLLTLGIYLVSLLSCFVIGKIPIIKKVLI